MAHALKFDPVKVYVSVIICAKFSVQAEILFVQVVKVMFAPVEEVHVVLQTQMKQVVVMV